jgi:predicted DNA-binding protein (MmcQ/YjbR family)
VNLDRLTGICLALPEATREIQGQHAIFRVRKKVFAYYLNDHHGDGIISIACKSLPGDNARLAAAQPSRFYLPAYIGPRGWVALRLDVGRVDWNEVAELVSGSYRLIAPKLLLQPGARKPRNRRDVSSIKKDRQR